jgi:periplasmic divalent cation tolerance protein
MPERLIVLMTAGSQEEADKIAHALVSELLAACVNVLPRITSVYRWQDKIQSDQEWLLIAKSHSDALDELVRCVHSLHSYDTPEIIALPIVGGSGAYLRWIDSEVQGSWHDIN